MPAGSSAVAPEREEPLRLAERAAGDALDLAALEQEEITSTLQQHGFDVPPIDSERLSAAFYTERLAYVDVLHVSGHGESGADLEWLVLPPIMSGQFRLAQMPAPQGRLKGKDGGVLVPVAVALWARVSAAVDKQLSEGLDKTVRLGPGDWASGDNVWLMAVAGDRRAIPKFIDQLAKTEFKGQRVKMRVRGPGNSVVVKTLGQ